MRHLSITAAITMTLAALAYSPASAQQTKTAAQCNADYAANKAAIQAAKLKKKDFVASCRSGNEVIPSAAAAAPSPTPAAPAPAQPAAAAPAPAQTAAPAPASTLNPFARRKVAPPVTTAGAPVAANQYASATQAEGRCPGATIVWVNTKSGVYHFAGTKNYGTTKAGAYMCENDATAAGDRASKQEKHP